MKIDQSYYNDNNGWSKKRTVRSKRLHTIETLPRLVHLDGTLNVEKRAYGLHETAVFELQGSITGTFDTFFGLVDDGRGFSMSTFAVTTATASTLAVNTWYLEQTASGITFHYKVAGSVPEPGTFSLSLLGVWIARSLRRRSTSSTRDENLPGATVEMIRVRQRRDPHSGRMEQF